MIFDGYILVFFVFVVPLAILLLALFSHYSYQKILYMKAKNHEVEFILNEPIVLLSEKEYIELKYGRK